MGMMQRHSCCIRAAAASAACPHSCCLQVPVSDVLPSAPTSACRPLPPPVASYSPKVGAIQSWNDKDKGEFEVIIDSMASLKLLWEAAALPGGRPEWAAAALRHARTVAAGLFR